MNTRLAIICTHPIQYYCPVFKRLAGHIDLKVFYTLGAQKHYDPDFQRNISWDIPLLEGYEYEFLINTSKKAGTSGFMGTINPDAIVRIGKFRPQAVLIYGWAHFSHFRIMKHFKGKIPVLFRGDSTVLYSESLVWSFIRTVALRYVYSYIDAALYVGTNNKEYYKEYAAKETRLFFCPHATDNERFGRPQPGNTVRRLLKIQRSAILILFSGKLIPLKNPELLISAFLELQRPNVHLLIVGDGPLASPLRQKYEHPNIHFLPFQNQRSMASVYQACDLFCMPSHAESWGLSLNEAMAAGKAVLASDTVGAVADLVRPANGMVFRSNDAKDLLKKLKLMTDDPENLQLMGKASRSIIANWSFQEQVKQILNAIHQYV